MGQRVKGHLQGTKKDPTPAKQSDMGRTGKMGQESNETFRNTVCASRKQGSEF